MVFQAATVPLADRLNPVLFVNQRPDTFEMYRIGLGLAGFRAVLVPDAASACRTLDTEQPVAMVADLHPGGKGDEWQAIETIRRNPASGGVPLVVLTALINPVVQHQVDRVGGAVLVQTPCLPKELADVLESVAPRPGQASDSLRTPRHERRRQRRDQVRGEPQRSSLQAMIVGTYREMPGLSLSLPQAARFFGLRERTCRVVLAHLIGAGLLRLTPTGHYAAP